MNEYYITKHLIKKCFNINFSIPKGYGTRSSNYAFWYNQKKQLLIKIISNIKTYKLNIKYGIKYDVLYFAFEGEQYSFHCLLKDYYYPDSPFWGVKEYKGNWCGTRRTKYQTYKNSKCPIGTFCLYRE